MYPPFRLHRKVKRGDLECVRELLKADASEINRYDRHDEYGRTPLMYAVESPTATVEVVRVLLEHGAEVRGDYTLMGCCLRAGDPDKLRIVLEHGAPLDKRN